MDITDATIMQKDPTGIIFCKGQDTFTPVGKFIPKSSIPDPQDVDLQLNINGELRVKGNTELMINTIPKTLQICSHYMTLEPGDLILTGTPTPLGTIVAGDLVHCKMSKNGNLLDEFKLKVEEAT